MVFQEQPVVSRSSTEAEYRALVDCSCEITWLCSLLIDQKVLVPKPVRILCDNISTIALASNLVQHARTKHIELDCHFVRDKIKAGQIIISYIPTTKQAADLFTKALPTYPFHQCLSKLGMCEPYTLPTCGRDNGIYTKANAHVNIAVNGTVDNGTMNNGSAYCNEVDQGRSSYVSPHCIKHQGYLNKCDVIR